MTTTKVLPTAHQLQEYAQKMPQVYRDVLAAIQQVEPRRRRGEGVFESSLRNYCVNHYFKAQASPTPTTPGDAIPIFGDDQEHSRSGDFYVVLERLAEADFLMPLSNTGWGTIVPTELGEELITAVTGKRTPKYEVPELPRPNW